MKQIITVPKYGTRTIHFGHWFPRLFMKVTGGVNLGVTPNASTILFAQDWCTAHGLAHEWGHTKQAETRGWRYLPWVVWGYLRTLSHDNAPAEVDADAFMDAHWRDFPAIGPVPLWVVKDGA